MIAMRFPDFTSEQIVALVVACMTLVGVLYAAWAGRATKKDTKEINLAVNHISPDGIRLYDICIRLDNRLDNVEDKIDKIDRAVTSCPFLHLPMHVPDAESKIHIQPLDNIG